MSVRAVLAGGFAVLLAALFVTLAQSQPRSSGSNQVPELQEVVKVRGSRGHCQNGEIVPADTAALRLLIGTYGRPAPELGVVVRAGGKLVTSGRRAAGGSEGRVDVPVRTMRETTVGNRVCIGVTGGGRTVLYGSGGRVHLEWMRTGSESWLELLPVVAHRFGLAKANPLRSLLLSLAALILLAAWIGAARLVLREVGR